MVTIDEQKIDTTASDNGTEKKARKRIDPRVKMVKALQSILGEQLRENELGKAHTTTGTILEYLEQLNDD